jgi:hypothetical protein
VPGASREAVFIDFHWFSLISKGFEVIWGQKVGQPVAGCGIEWRICPTPFRMLQSVSCGHPGKLFSLIFICFH